MRLIDADALISDVLEAKKKFIGSPSEAYRHDLICDNVVRWVDYANTVDDISERHGHWNMVQDFGEVLMTLECRRCSVCGCTGYHNDYRYCPHCGARMDADEQS